MFALVEVTVRVPEGIAPDDETRGTSAESAVKALLSRGRAELEGMGLEILSVEYTVAVSE